MIAGTIWNQLVTTISENPTLSSYIKQVYEGRRVDIEPESLPSIHLEPIRDGEIDRHTNTVQDLYFTVNIFVFSSNNFNEFPKTIVGDQMYKGILDINNDLRACLMSSNTLGETVIDIKIDPSEFDTLDTEKYPVRGMVMPVRILYRQFNGV